MCWSAGEVGGSAGSRSGRSSERGARCSTAGESVDRWVEGSVESTRRTAATKWAATSTGPAVAGQDHAPPSDDSRLPCDQHAQRRANLSRSLPTTLSSSPVLVTELGSWLPNRVTASPLHTCTVENAGEACMQDLIVPAVWNTIGWILLSLPLGICCGAVLRRCASGLAEPIYVAARTEPPVGPVEPARPPLQ
jgi:hypothetical protein